VVLLRGLSMGRVQETECRMHMLEPWRQQSSTTSTRWGPLQEDLYAA
jgi:hypothetical protein